jgi:hypothetical protein
MNLKLLIASLAILYAFPGTLGSTETQHDKIEAISLKIEQLKKEEERLEKKITEKIYSIKAIVDNYSRSESEFQGFNGLGRIEVLQLKAQRYAIEKEARQIIEKEVFELIKMLKDWEIVKNRMREDHKLMELREKIVKLETNVEEEKTLSLNKEDIEYYEVKKDSTLKQISEMPEVYGNAEDWKYLFESNKDKIKDPEAVVKKGTVLIVPNIKNDLGFGRF